MHGIVCVPYFTSFSLTLTLTLTHSLSSQFINMIGQRTKLILMVLIIGVTCLLLSLAESKPTHVINSACKHTLYQEACESALLSSTTNLKELQIHNPMQLFDLSVQFSLGRAQSARALAYNFSQLNQKAPPIHPTDAMNDCVDLLDDSLDQLTNVVGRNKNLGLLDEDDVQTWLSAALTNQATCLQSLKGYKFEAEKGMVDVKAQNLSQLISNSLALYMSAKTKPSGGRRLLSDGSPAWLLGPERKLLEAPVEEMGAKAVVAKDGSGTHRSIGEALASLAGEGRSVIHVTAGTYNEYLKIPAANKNVMLVGDGKGKTVIVGNRNAEDGWTTFQSATVSAMGDGFIARDITFVNSAGPAKHQAVALLVKSDKSVIYRCSIIGYQDTLYTHSLRQFYTETDIYGTVDFIFGNSAVVLQNCNIYPRKPMSGQKNFITAQGRSDPNQNTGIAIHKCNIAAASDLAGAKTFLGRPWQKYSRTVVMQSFLDASIHPLGWAPWSGSSAFASLFYGEYMNSGPGSSTSGRVKWAGYHASLSTAEAQGFTVGSFISGNLWLPATGVPFDSGLLP